MSKLNQYLEMARKKKRSLEDFDQNIQDYVADLEAQLIDAAQFGEDPEQEYNRLYMDLRELHDIDPMNPPDEVFDAEDIMLANFNKKY